MQENLSLKKSKKFSHKGYRDAFVRRNLISSLAHQIRINRKSRGWSQKQLADKIGSKQSVISRYEDTAYGKHSLATLLEIANALDVGLEVKFTSFSRLIGSVQSWEPKLAVAEPYDIEVASIKDNSKKRVTSLRSSEYSSHIYSADAKDVEYYKISRGDGSNVSYANVR